MLQFDITKVDDLYLALSYVAILSKEERRQDVLVNGVKTQGLRVELKLCGDGRTRYNIVIEPPGKS